MTNFEFYMELRTSLQDVIESCKQLARAYEKSLGYCPLEEEETLDVMEHEFALLEIGYRAGALPEEDPCSDTN